MSDSGIGTEQDAFDPTENGSVGADAYREADDRENRKTGITHEHTETEAKVLEESLEEAEGAGFAGDVVEFPVGVMVARRRAKW